MNPKRSSWQKARHAVFPFFVTVLLLFGLVPRHFAMATQQSDWADSIAEMIASGEYVEGEAIVALLGGEADALTAQAGLPVDALEPLMGVSAEAAGVPAAVDPLLTAQAERGVTLTLVRSDTLTTEEILRSLADDPNVAFAEPNYTIELAESDEDLAAVPEIVSFDIVTADEAPALDEDGPTNEDHALTTELPPTDEPIADEPMPAE